MNTRRRLIAILLATVSCLPGCGGAGEVAGLRTPPYQPPDIVVIVPTRLTLRVNEARRIDAILEGPIAGFVRCRWTVSSSSIALVSSGCSDGAGHIRECGALITAVAEGTVVITFTASLRDDDLYDRQAALEVSVVP